MFQKNPLEKNLFVKKATVLPFFFSFRFTFFFFFTRIHGKELVYVFGTKAKSLYTEQKEEKMTKSVSAYSDHLGVVVF